MNKQQTAKQVRAILKRKFQNSYASRGWRPHSGHYHIVEGYRVIATAPKKVIVTWDEHHLIPLGMTMQSTTEKGQRHAEIIRERYARHAAEYSTYLLQNGIDCKVTQDSYGVSYVVIEIK